jgi:hypothetical protein
VNGGGWGCGHDEWAFAHLPFTRVFAPLFSLAISGPFSGLEFDLVLSEHVGSGPSKFARR